MAESRAKGTKTICFITGVPGAGKTLAGLNMAMQACFTMCEAKDQSEVNRIRTSLLEYCKLDTMGMVKILGKLRTFR